METKEKLETIVFVFDLQSLGIHVDLPAECKALKISDVLLDKYCPSFLERVSKMTMQVCFEAYKVKVPEATFKDFHTKFLNTKAGFEGYKQTMSSLNSKMVEKIEVEALREFHQQKCLNLTKADAGKLNPSQIEFPKKRPKF